MNTVNYQVVAQGIAHVRSLKTVKKKMKLKAYASYLGNNIWIQYLSRKEDDLDVHSYFFL